MTEWIRLTTCQLPLSELQYSICAYVHSNDYYKFKMVILRIIYNTKGLVINDTL